MTLNHYLPWTFPLAFAGLWLGVTTMLGVFSGWFRLMRLYPDRAETPIERYSWQSGRMGGVRMNNLLKIGICPGGLRVGMPRIFGLFSRNFFVPWTDIKTEEARSFFFDATRLTFGTSGGMVLYGDCGRKLAALDLPAHGPLAPEKVRAIPRPANRVIAMSILKSWALSTGTASAFFIIVPRLVAPAGETPPLAVAIGFPATVFGISGVITYIVRTRRT